LYFIFYEQYKIAPAVPFKGSVYVPKYIRRKVQCFSLFIVAR